jgi:hypothetical protein
MAFVLGAVFLNNLRKTEPFLSLGIFSVRNAERVKNTEGSEWFI